MRLTATSRGPNFLASFTGDRREGPDADFDTSGNERLVTGLVSACITTMARHGNTIRPITDDGRTGNIETMDGRTFTMGLSSAEPGGLPRCAPRGWDHPSDSSRPNTINLAC